MKFRWRKIIPAAVGLIAAFGFYQSTASIRKDLRDSQKRVDLLTAAENLAPGDPITPQNTRVLSAAASGLPPGLIYDAKDLLDDKREPIFRARGPFLKGEYIARTRLQDKRVELGLAWRLEKGKVAATFQFPFAHALGGNLQPGDSVGVLATIDGQDGWPHPKTVSLLNGARVMGINKTLWEPWSESLKKEADASNFEEDIFVTLSVSPYEAARLRLAEKKGALSLVLLSPVFPPEALSPSAKISSLERRP